MGKTPPFNMLIAILFFVPAVFFAQEDWFRTGINLGVEKIRLAHPKFQPRSADLPLNSVTDTFNEVLWNDLEGAGIFEMVNPSFYPLEIPTEPQEVKFEPWSEPPVQTQMLVFGKTETIQGNLVVTARLFDIRSPLKPAVLAKRYVSEINKRSARGVAHRFADEIILNLGGGLPGINSTQITFVSKRSGHEEIMIMDYDGNDQLPLTNYKSMSLTPRWSHDNTRIAFTSYSTGTPQIFIHSLETNRRIPFPTYRGLNTTPAWSPKGDKIAFCSSMSGDPEIYVSDVSGFNLQRLTFSRGVDISPSWNPRTGNEIAFISDRIGPPQLYIMDANGSNVRRVITMGGSATTPAWSPNGQFIVFAWMVGETGNFDIYLLEIASGRVVQLTHDSGRNERPSWAPDGRHIVFESNRSGSNQVWLMLSDGSSPSRLTSIGRNWGPAWSNLRRSPGGGF